MLSLATVPAARLLAAHHPVGASTGFLRDGADDWDVLLERARLISPFAAELAALSERELPSLLAYLTSRDTVPFHYISVHAPSKHRQLSEPELVAFLAELPPYVDAIVAHPDVLEDPAAYRPLGARLVLENMDTRKATGRTADELAFYFTALPEAGLCLDVAHARDVDASLADAHDLLDRFGARLRHLHVSSLDADGHHVSLRPADEEAFESLLRRCRDVPWILEAPLTP